MEDKLDLISSLGKIAVFLMILLSGFLLTVKGTKKVSNYLFATFLLLVAFDLTGFFITDWVYERLHLNILRTASSILQTPLFFLYVLSVCYSDFKLKSIHLLHGLLFFIFGIFFEKTSLSDASYRIFEIVIEIQWFVYMIAIFTQLKRRKTIHQENYSHSNSDAYRWLFQVTIVSCIAHSFVLFRSFLPSDQFAQIIVNINIVISISTLLIITWFVLKALHHPQLFTGVKTSLEPIKASLPKTKNTPINSTVIKEDIQKVQTFMETKKPYLDFELTLEKLATQLERPEKEVSTLINHHMGKHFFHFVNDYRIDEAKALLENAAKRNMTVLEILYQVGFNSKSSFYTAFKKATNLTPSQYRKQFSS